MSGRMSWMWMWLLLAFDAVHFVICIICIVVFDQVAHLGWTIDPLSYNGCIITVRVLAGFCEYRYKIKGDQHKARAAYKYM